MILQIRDITVTSAGEDLYTVLHNATASQLSTFLHTEMVDMIGNSIGIFLLGVAVTLGIYSMLLLSSKPLLSTQDTLLRAYTIVLLLLVVAFQIQALFITFLPFMSLSHSLGKRIEGYTRLNVVMDATLVVMAGLADGLLVSSNNITLLLMACFDHYCYPRFGGVSWSKECWVITHQNGATSSGVFLLFFGLRRLVWLEKNFKERKHH